MASETIVFPSIFLNVLEEVSEGILILNEDGELLFFNEVFLKIIHGRAEEILGNEKSFLEKLNLSLPPAEGVSQVSFSDVDKVEHPLRLKSLSVEAQNGYYYLISVRELGQNELVEDYKAHYDLLLRNVGDPLLNASLEGTISTANPAFFSALGYKEGEVLPSLTEMYVYRDDLDEKIQRLLKDGSVYNLEAHLYAKDGLIKRVLDNSWLIYDEEGVVKGYAAHFHDITYLKNLESRLKISERNFTILFDTILSSVLIFDPNGRILNLNSAAERIYGLEWEALVGEHYDEVLRYDKNTPRFAKIVEQVKRGEGTYYLSEVPRRKSNGEPIFTFAIFTEIRDIAGEVIAYSLAEKDLTERVHLENKLRDSFKEIKDTRSAAIIGFAKLTEYRDKDTGKHLERIREYTRLLALTLRELPKYRDYISEEYIEDLTLSSILHDVGKIGIEDNILLKPGKLDIVEFDRIKTHASLGREALDVVESKLKKKSFLTLGKEIAMYHHEYWDGSGYPKGLKGEEIPLSARIVAIADVYDALTSKRPYKEAFGHEEAVDLIEQARGTQFDPDIVDAFMKNHEVFERIRRFIDFEENPETIDSLIENTVQFPLEDEEGGET